VDRELLSREQWAAWRNQEETQHFLRFLAAQVAEAKQAWAKGQFTSASLSSNEIAVANIAAVENVQFCERIMAMEYEDYLTAMEKE